MGTHQKWSFAEKKLKRPPRSWSIFLTLTGLLLGGWLLGMQSYEYGSGLHIVHRLNLLNMLIGMILGGGLGYGLAFWAYKVSPDEAAFAKIGRGGLIIECIILLLGGIVLGGLIYAEHRPVPPGGTPDVLESLGFATASLLEETDKPSLMLSDLDRMDLYRKKVAGHYCFRLMIPQTCWRVKKDGYHFYDEWGSEIHIEKKEGKHVFVSNGPNKQYDGMSGDDLTAVIELEEDNVAGEE